MAPDPPAEEQRRLRAGIVVLAAGALGSTEILLRSREAGLPVSRELGRRLSGNADFLAFAYDCDDRIDGIGRGAGIDPRRAVGPCISGAVDLRVGRPASEGVVIEEGTIPSPLAKLLPLGLLLASLRGSRRPGGRIDRRGIWRRLRSLATDRSRGSMARTLTFLAMGVDDDRGIVTLRRGRPILSWPGAAGDRFMHDHDDTLRAVAHSLGGTYLRSPVWRSPFGNRFLTVHPLGGCDMADHESAGVVDNRGRVFAGHQGTDVHDGLYVADGAIQPTSLGANPSLTITALAERIAALLVASRQLPEDAGPVVRRLEDASAAPGPPSLRFRERLTGSLVDARGHPAGALEACRLADGEGLIRQVGQGRPSPQRQGGAQRGRGPLWLCAEHPVTGGGEALEAQRVELLVPDHEQVAGRPVLPTWPDRRSGEEWRAEAGRGGAPGAGARRRRGPMPPSRDRRARTGRRAGDRRVPPTARCRPGPGRPPQRAWPRRDHHPPPRRRWRPGGRSCSGRGRIGQADHGVSAEEGDIVELRGHAACR